MRPVELLIVGAGSRGSRYAEYATEHPELVRIVGVAEPREFFRTRLAKTYALRPEHTVGDWQDLADLPKFVEAGPGGVAAGCRHD